MNRLTINRPLFFVGLVAVILVLMLLGILLKDRTPAQVAIPTLAELPSITPSQDVTKTPEPVGSVPTASQLTPTITQQAIPTREPELWVVGENGAIAYGCPDMACPQFANLDPGFQFLPLETINGWHAIASDSGYTQYVLVEETVPLSEAPVALLVQPATVTAIEQASTTPTVSQDLASTSPTPTASVSTEPTGRVIVISTQSSTSGNDNPSFTNPNFGALPTSVWYTETPQPSSTPVLTNTPQVIGTVAPTEATSTTDPSDIPPTPIATATDPADDLLPPIPTLTPTAILSPTQTEVQPPPPIVLPLPNQ